MCVRRARRSRSRTGGVIRRPCRRETHAYRDYAFYSTTYTVYLLDTSSGIVRETSVDYKNPAVVRVKTRHKNSIYKTRLLIVERKGCLSGHLSYPDMAPSAVEEHNQISIPVKRGTEVQEHDTTPLEAISHGDVMPGKFLAQSSFPTQPSIQSLTPIRDPLLPDLRPRAAPHSNPHGRHVSLLGKDRVHRGPVWSHFGA